MIKIGFVVPYTSNTKFTNVNYYIREKVGIGAIVYGINNCEQKYTGLSYMYNMGASMLIGKGCDILVFMHDDVRIMSKYVGKFINESLQKFDIVGVAGSTVMTAKNASWAQAGHPYVKGRIIHDIQEKTEKMQTIHHKQLAEYSSSEEPQQVVVVDGVFISMTPDTFKRLQGFDVVTFNGWHCYDVDICMRANLEGMKLGVDPRIALCHYSVGVYDQMWKDTSNIFVEKYKEYLPYVLNETIDFDPEAKPKTWNTYELLKDRVK